jgi:hypothetical protein
LNDGIPYFCHIELPFPVSRQPISAACHNFFSFAVFFA